MRVIFAGTPEFARVALVKLHAAGYEIALVLTQPDRPAGRGMALQPSSVKQWATGQGVPLAQPRSLRLDGKYPDDATQARLAIEAARADVMVVAAYGLLLPQWVLDAPRLGCLNIHASLLPRWRGAAPIHRAIEAGDHETGVTIMQMDAGLDTGAMLLTQRLAISADDSTASLHDKLADLGGQLIVEALQQATRHGLQPVAQPVEGITYAHKIEKREAWLDWTQNAAVLERRIRAFNPFPVAAGVLAGQTLKFWRATVLDGADRPAGAVPGQVLSCGPDGVDIRASDAILRVGRLQKPGGKPLDAAEFLRGFDIQPGMVFDPVAADTVP
ncbi:MAG: methionyl-tRNA formyltransferase [Polaromonas sp. 39-63-203]|jgi:methionyl-tRNA formyltransferase|uniref:methionyl-tRNA formyltransferase n=1 Tax=Polaromonas sp. TaxID=1869339 RepID=UPI000BDADF08|nr:methionyl-tRNA formyltransferase [Polaromonas sp.]OYY50514.1 MAG: methionyl-tRNA formyltransferase [Polaromonas sp. 35-63-240]OYY92306.1 MAG: methionyl-tRNA formyltransferase [Polaromonas sp. 28-63-22]OYZ83465.1 MAG: methionyl-tRNA formyltransferase [Polaromonas sp. 24-62-144]OZA95382.1 MAG: methionyl-tRNA formyltransferase [Polaromonas sp. 39-63-203]HQS31766.1 methionyl-tRNA formyltransferase [Polaromonas sp.]